MSLIISHLRLVKSNILPSVQFYFQQEIDAKVNPSPWMETLLQATHILWILLYLTKSALQKVFLLPNLELEEVDAPC